MKPLRTLILIAAALTSLSLACASDPPASTATTAPAAPVADAEAIVGTWTGSNTTINFIDASNFKWQETRPCGAPPCPATMTQGTYQLRRGQIYITVPGQTDKVYAYTLRQSPRGLSLKGPDGREYQLQ